MGPELFLIKEILKTIQSHCLNPGLEDFNYHVFRAGEMNPARMRETIVTVPVLSDKRMVLCEDAHRFSESDWKEIEPVLKKTIKHLCVGFYLERT